MRAEDMVSGKVPITRTDPCNSPDSTTMGYSFGLSLSIISIFPSRVVTPFLCSPLCGTLFGTLSDCFCSIAIMTGAADGHEVAIIIAPAVDACDDVVDILSES